MVVRRDDWEEVERIGRGERETMEGDRGEMMERGREIN